MLTDSFVSLPQVYSTDYSISASNYRHVNSRALLYFTFLALRFVHFKSSSQLCCVHLELLIAQSDAFFNKFYDIFVFSNS